LSPGKIEALRRYLLSLEEVAFSVLFGSAAAHRLMAESDVDIGMYLRSSSTTGVDLEEIEAASDREPEIWLELERIVGRTVDLVVLNRASASTGSEALRSGIPLSIRDPDLFRGYQLAASDRAEEFRAYVDDFVRVRSRSRSLAEVDRTRLERILDFLERELADSHVYGSVTRERYVSDAVFRRSLERWVENLVNASIDVAKIVVAAAGLPLPQTYRESLEEVGTQAGFDVIADGLARNAGVRNVLAHEYLDVRFREVQRVVQGAEALYRRLIEATRSWIAAASLPPTTPP
jgi:hypothetical protein